MSLRHEAEEQTRILIESSPAAIVTADDKGTIRLANEAAHRLLGSGEPLQGQPIANYLPSLAKIPQGDGKHSHFRTEMECTGQRQNGEMFMAHVWFATYQTRSGTRMAAVLSDSSEELRERETGGLDSLMKTSRVLVGAMLHEVRNLCAAAGVAHTNLARKPELREDEDFEALGSLIKGLGSIASSELRLTSERRVSTVDLRTVLNELQIATGPALSEAGIAVHWEMPAFLPLARADHQSLLQVFLNVVQNSVRAMEETARKDLTVAVSTEKGSLTIRFRDTGHGVAEPSRLFRPFHPDAETTGLGLYVSRAIMRSLKGDLFYEPQEVGSCFTVQMGLAEESDGDST
jgi:PAS domain S-box-containing protein